MLIDEQKNRHVDGIDRIRTAYIKYKDITVGTITDEYSSTARAHSWVIKPNYDGIAKASETTGYDVILGGADHRKGNKEYVFQFEPLFIKQRVPRYNSRGIVDLLDRLGLCHYDTFEVLIRSHGVTGNDELYVVLDETEFVDRDKLPVAPTIYDHDEDTYGWLQCSAVDRHSTKNLSKLSLV